MTWVKLDDGFGDHPKVDSLSDGAYRLHVNALCWCCRYLTDGFVAADRVARLAPRYKPAQATELVAAGLWEKAEGGWLIHDFLVYQPPASKVIAEREAAAERMRKRRTSTNGSPERSPERTAERSPEHPKNERRVFGDPVPSRPLTNTSSSSSRVRAPEESEEETAAPRDTVLAAAVLHARQALAAQPEGAVRHAGRWKQTAAYAWLDEHQERCFDLLTDDPTLTGADLLAKIERPTTNPGYVVHEPVVLPEITDEERAKTKATREEMRAKMPSYRTEEATG